MKNKNKEFRNISLVTPNDEDEMIIRGAIKYNSESHDLGFREIIAPGAFKKTLSDGADVKAYFNHDSSKVLGRVKNRSLILNDTSEGLEFEIHLPDTQEGRDAYHLVKNNFVDGVSFGFVCIRDRWSHNVSGEDLREVCEAKLIEITICPDQAYPEDTCYARSLSKALEEKELDEKDKEEISAEIERLQAMLAPKDEPKEDPEKPVEEPAPEPNPQPELLPEEDPKEDPKPDEPDPADPEPQPEPEEPKEDPDQKEYEELMQRLKAAEEIIKACRSRIY